MFCPKCGAFVSSDTHPCEHCGFNFSVVVVEQKNITHGIHKISDIQDFFPFSIHIIYGIILTLGYEIAAKIFIPIHDLLIFDKFLNALGLIAIYLIIVSGWIGYTKSIIHKPHKDNNSGKSRFIIELLITFLVFYLLELSADTNFKEYYGESFIWVLPVIFTFYLVWDFLKFLEYKREHGLSNRIVKTGFALTAVLVQAFLYALLSGCLPQK